MRVTWAMMNVAGDDDDGDGDGESLMGVGPGNIERVMEFR